MSDLEKKEKRLAIARIIISVSVIIIMIIGTIAFLPMISKMSNEETRMDFKNDVANMGLKGVFVVLILQILQIVVAVVPGQPMEIISGMLYGTWGGMLLCLVGILIGTTIIFYVVRKIGVSFIELFFSKEKIEEAVVKIITENQNNDRETGLGEVGSRLVKLYPDFDVRRYGYSLLSKFLESLPKLMLMQEGTKVTVTIYEDKSRKEMLEEYILLQIQSAGGYGIPLSSLGNRIRMRFGDFKVRDYGFSQFKQYIASFPDVEFVDDEERTRAVYMEE